MIPFKDLCAAIDRYRAQLESEGRGPVAVSNGETPEHVVASDDHTLALPLAGTFPDPALAGAQVLVVQSEGAIHETSEIDLAGAEIVEEEDLE